MKGNALMIGGIVMMSWIGSLLSAEGIDEEKSVSLDGLEGIRTELHSISLRVTPVDGDAVTVHLHGRSLRKLQLVTRVEKGVLVVSVLRSGGLPIYERVAMVISLPRSRAKGLSLATGTSSGNVELGSIELASYTHEGSSGRLTTHDLAADRVSVRTTSGSVRMGRLEGGKLELTGSSANVTVEVCRVKEASIETSSGNVDLPDSEGTISATSRSGNVRIAYASFERQDATIETASGSARLELPGDAEFALDARSASGRIRCDFPLVKERAAGDKHLAGRVGRAANQVSIRSASGAVSVVKR